MLDLEESKIDGDIQKDVEVHTSEIALSLELRDRILKALRAIRSNPRSTGEVIEELSQTLTILNGRIDVLQHH